MTTKEDIAQLSAKVEDLTRGVAHLNDRVYALEQNHEPPHGKPDSIEQVEWEFTDDNGVQYAIALPKGKTPVQARVANAERYRVKVMPEVREMDLPEGFSLDD